MYQIYGLYSYLYLYCKKIILYIPKILCGLYFQNCLILTLLTSFHSPPKNLQLSSRRELRNDFSVLPSIFLYNGSRVQCFTEHCHLLSSCTLKILLLTNVVSIWHMSCICLVFMWALQIVSNIFSCSIR
jgi:hypothetical protein